MRLFPNVSLFLLASLALCSPACVLEQGGPQAESELDAAEFSAGGDRLRELLGERDAEGWQTGPLIDAQGAFDRVGVMFDARTPIELEVRTSADEGATWTPWSAADLVWSEDNAHNMSADVEEGTHIGVRFRAPVEADLSFVRLIAFSAPAVDDSLDLDTAAETEQGLARDHTEVVSRSEWGARAAGCGSASHTPNRITVHHTETPNGSSVSVPARMRQIQSFHIDVRNWCDIGYHLLIGPDGQIYQGRLENKRGAHAGSGNNTNNVGVSFIGSFMSVLPAPQQLDAGARALAAVAGEWGIALNRTKVKGHRELKATDCPGDTLFNFLGDLVTMASDGSVAPRPPQASCTSSTLGATVASGDCVQVNYEACGLDTCAWFRCNSGSWLCTDVDLCEGEEHAQTQCDVVTDPVDTEPDDGVIGPINAFPYSHSSSTAPSSTDVFDDYSCDRSKSESGPEVVYEVHIEGEGVLSASVTDGASIDVDVHLLSDLDDSACLDRDDTSASSPVSPGIYYVVVDTYRSGTWGERPGPYTLSIDFAPSSGTDIGTGDCAMEQTTQEMFWSSCSGSIDSCVSQGGARFVELPATGPMVKEAHLVTTDDGFGSGWPSSFTHGIDAHHNLSEGLTGYDMGRQEPWAPAGEGGSQYGQGSTGGKIPALDEAWYITMYWKQRPAGGTRMIVSNPANGRSVVASAGWETGPGSSSSLAGVTEEIHHYLGTGHLDDLTVGYAVQQDLPLGPIACGAGEPDPDPIDDEPEPIEVPETGSYDDLPVDHPAYSAAEQLRALGALWGCAPGSFCPDAALHRDQLANVMAVVMTSPFDPSDASSFSDMNEDHWAFEHVQELSARQVTYGCGGGQYCPEADVSRASFAVYLRRAMGLNGLAGSPADDVSNAHWAAASIGAVLDAGLMDDCGFGDFCPSDAITRADAARFVERAWLD